MTTEPRKQFADAEHAVIYNRFRPKADPKIIEKVITYLKQKATTGLNTAVDIACGSGQGTTCLGEHFNKVLGIDISAAQINEAKRTNTADNIEYMVGDAEHIPLPDQSVDLVTCSQAAHWFDFAAFFSEVDRVLTPNGVLAVYSRGDYTLLHENPEVEKELTKNYKECTWKTLADYWNDPVHAARQNGYVDLDIPYPQFERHNMQSTLDLSLTELSGFISSFTAYQRFQQANPDEDIFTSLHDRFLKTLGVDSLPEKTIVTTSCPISLLLGRKPAAVE